MKTIFGWFDFENIYDTIYDRIDGGVFVEVGSFLGKSTAYMCSKLKKKDKFGFIQVDTWQGTPGEHEELIKRYGNLYDAFIKNMTERGYLDIITPYRMTSKEAAGLLPNCSIDAVFIDANHSYESVKEDISLWVKKLKPGGIIAGHDIDFPTVWRAVNESFKSFEVSNRSWITYKENYERKN